MAQHRHDDEELNFLEDLPDEFRRMWLELERKRDAKFAEIIALLDAGRDPERLSADVIRELETKAGTLVENWAVAEHDDPPPSPKTTLDRLLKDHYDLGEEMIGVVDWATALASGL
jgi:hypothetical protein